MSTTICRGCGQPLDASQNVCTNCGIRTTLPSNGSGPVMENTMPVAAATPAAGMTPADTAPMNEQTAPQSPAMQVFNTPPQPAPTPQWTPPPMYPQQTKSLTSQPDKMRKIAIGAITALLVGALAHFVAARANGAPGELAAQLPVGPAGGSTTFGNGGKITVPKGAVSKPETIKVYKRTLPQRVTFNRPTGGTPLIFPPGTLVVFAFGPTTLIFQQPVVILLPIPPGQRGVVFVSANGQITFLPGTGTGRTVRLLVTTFNLNAPGAIRVA